MKRLSKSPLLSSYQALWNNRSFKQEGKEDQEILFESIKSELLDLHTHPRLRLTKEEKFFQAMKRIAKAELNETIKLDLIQIYIIIMEELGRSIDN